MRLVLLAALAALTLAACGPLDASDGVEQPIASPDGGSKTLQFNRIQVRQPDGYVLDGGF